MSERFTLWFGNWPPKTNKWGEELERRKLGKIFSKTNAILLLAFLFGIGMMWLHEKYQWHSIVEGLGVAFVIASILGFAIDKVLKRELAEEAVKAAQKGTHDEIVSPQEADRYVIYTYMIIGDVLALLEDIPEQ